MGFLFSLQLVCPLLGVCHCLLPFLWVETHWGADGDVVAKWDGTVSYSHWQGRLLDEAESTGLRRWAKERMDKFYRQSVARVAVAKWDVLFKLWAEAWRTRRSRHEGRVWDDSNRDAVATQMRHAFWQSSRRDW